MDTVGAIVSNLLGIFVVVAIIYGLHKISQVNKDVYMQTSEATRKMMGQSGPVIAKESARSSSMYDAVSKWAPFVAVVIFFVIGIVKLKRVPKDETADEAETRQMIGIVWLGGAGLTLIAALINLLVRIF